MQAFVVSDINSSLDEVTALPFLLEGDGIDYYHSRRNRYKMIGSN